VVSNVAFKYRDVLEDDAEEKGNSNEVEGAVRRMRAGIQRTRTGDGLAVFEVGDMVWWSHALVSLERGVCCCENSIFLNRCRK